MDNARLQNRERMLELMETRILRGSRDLRIHGHKSLKASALVHKVIKLTHGMLSFISRGLDYKTNEVMHQFCHSMVRPL